MKLNLDSVINNNLNKQFSNYSNKKNENKKLIKGINKWYKNSKNHKNLNKNNIRAEKQNSFVLNNCNNVNDNKVSIDLNEQRLELPISSVRNKIIDAIKRCESIVLIGETGCGKTTQIPQYLFEANFISKNGLNGMIGITQPRRVAAITIANRVAQEMGSQLGSVVGYSVRFEDMTSLQTKIKYMTDGTLLREAISDPLLMRYKVIVLDEAHERTVQTDLLFGVVKKAQTLRNENQRPVLKVIIMSATMDCDHFSNYFNKAPVYYIIGRQHSIQMMYTCEKQSDFINSALITVFQIHQNEEFGDILVFCTGQEEIESMIRAVNEVIPQLTAEYQNIKAYPLYAALPSYLQQKAFKKLEGLRKVIFATNIAETSITIPNIKYVIDTGKVKSRTYNPITGFETLKIQAISKAQACQRSGRAGREFSGVCYRLYTKEEYDCMRVHAIPEIQRCNLANVLLHLIAIGVNNIEKFDFMDSPSEENMKNALQQLIHLGAIELKQQLHYLTEIGKTMVIFPVEPKYSKIIISSKAFRCTEEIITILSLLSVDSIYYIPSSQRDLAIKVHKKFASGEGDVIQLLKVYRDFKTAKENKKWCKDNFIHITNMKLALEIRKQLIELCVKANIPLVSPTNNTETIRKCLTSGLIFNAAVLQRDGSYKTLMTKQEVYIHPSSCLFGSKPEFVIFNELVQTSKCYMRNLSLIDKEWISEFRKSN